MLTHFVECKEYNYSLKMLGYTKDYYSEHSTNVKNPLFKGQDHKEDPENYFAREYDEGQRIKTKNYFSESMPERSQPRKGTLNDMSSPNVLGKNTSVDRKPLRLTTETMKKGPEGEQLIISTTKESPREQPMSPVKQDGIKRELIWQYQPNDKDIPSMEVNSLMLPDSRINNIQMHISANEFSTNSIQFFLWSVKNAEGPARADTIFIDHKLAGECYISLSKIYSELENLVLIFLNFSRLNLSVFFAWNRKQDRLSLTS